MSRPRLAIIGGGISGLILAIALHERGIPSTIYEQAPHFGEIGAGVAFGANAIRAMRYCSPKVEEAFRAVATGNKDLHDDCGKVKWFDFVDGWTEDESAEGGERYLFNVRTDDRGGVHRAHFLDELIKHAPVGVAVFDKHLDDIDEQADGTFRLRFSDGSTADADAIIGTDGIKSRLRSILYPQNPCATPLYTHKKAYRGLIPMARAVSLLGPAKAQNSTMHLGHGGHILTFPVAKGTVMNVVAFRQDDGDWPSETRLTLPSSKGAAMKEFQGFNRTARGTIEMLEPELDCWGIFDTGAHPVPGFNRGRMCVLGDAAHASAPHHGAGAGFCVEDCAVMAAVLALAQTREEYATGFAVFDAQRRERTQWLVESSRVTGDLYDWMDGGCGSDGEKIYKELDWRTRRIWDVDTEGMVRAAEEDMRGRLKANRVAMNGHT